MSRWRVFELAMTVLGEMRKIVGIQLCCSDGAWTTQAY